jgi:hypothetical protein
VLDYVCPKSLILYARRTAQAAVRAA